MDTRRGCNAAPDKERRLFVGKDPCCPPSPEYRDHLGSLFDELEKVALLKVMALTARHPYRIQFHGKAVDAEPLASQGSKPSSNDNDGSLRDSDPDPSGGGSGAWVKHHERKWRG